MLVPKWQMPCRERTEQIFQIMKLKLSMIIRKDISVNFLSFRTLAHDLVNSQDAVISLYQKHRPCTIKIEET